MRNSKTNFFNARWVARVVLTWALFPLILIACNGKTGAQTQGEDRQARLQRAQAMFQERCKAAGEKIYRTAENVDGILLMKVRPEEYNFSDQFALSDPYGRDSGGEAYIGSFLRGYLKAGKSGTPMDGEPTPPRYRYVEIIDPSDGKRYRYTGELKIVGKKDATAPNIRNELHRNPSYDLNNYAFKLDRVPAPGAGPRYGVTYDDISTPEEREYWIAGSLLRVIDLTTNEVMGERIGYMIDLGQGNTSGGRSPWLLAASHACPRFGSEKPKITGLPGFSLQQGQTRDFVTKVVKPIQGS